MKCKYLLRNIKWNWDVIYESEEHLNLPKAMWYSWIVLIMYKIINSKTLWDLLRSVCCLTRPKWSLSEIDFDITINFTIRVELNKKLLTFLIPSHYLTKDTACIFHDIFSVGYHCIYRLKCQVYIFYLHNSNCSLISGRSYDSLRIHNSCRHITGKINHI